MSNADKHVPVPWMIDRVNGKMYISSEAADWEVCTIGQDDNTIHQANAAFILRACNNHDALLAALEELIDAVPKQDNDRDWWEDELTRAMAKAKQTIQNAEQ